MSDEIVSLLGSWLNKEKAGVFKDARSSYLFFLFLVLRDYVESMHIAQRDDWASYHLVYTTTTTTTPSSFFSFRLFWDGLLFY